MDIITQTGEGENYYAGNPTQIFENKGNREFFDIHHICRRSRESELIKHPTHDHPAGMYQLVDRMEMAIWIYGLKEDSITQPFICVNTINLYY